MIKINKSNDIPDILRNEGIKAKNRLCDEYSSSPSAYISRPNFSNRKLKKLDIDSKIYGNSAVKKQLIEDQHGKCCFCEAKFTANSHGDVEHFRPKYAYKKEAKLIYPAYYWLAYDWNNLMFSCEKCNRSFKKNEFPLLDETTRVNNHIEAANLPNEKHVLINPITENPECFITFNQHLPIAINNNERGNISIKIYGLDRDELNHDRREYLNIMKVCEPFLDIDETDNEQIKEAVLLFGISENDVIELIKTAKKCFKNAAKKESKFAAMIRSNFPNLDKN